MAGDSSGGWIGVDLDGTLAEYQPEEFPRIGPPVRAMVDRVVRWLADGKQVRIVTARVASTSGTDTDRVFQRRLIQAWCGGHLGCVLPIQAEKDYRMICLYDDRCVQVEHNTGRLAASARHQPRPHLGPAAPPDA